MAKRKLNPVSTAFVAGIHLLALYTLVFRVILHHPQSIVWVLFAAVWIFSGLGVTIGYHRLETHGSFKCHPTVRRLLLIGAAMAGQGKPPKWIQNHRAHHRYQDQPGLDPHTPLEYPGIKGILWSHVGWVLCDYDRPMDPALQRRMDYDPIIQQVCHWYAFWVFASFFVPMVIAGWDGLLVAGVLRLVWSLNITWCVNSVCHVWGRRAKDAAGNRYLADDSRNNLLIAVLGFGEGNHSNHHAQQAWAFHGWKWYSIDPSKWVIALLEQLQLARDIKKPNLAIVFKQRQLAPPSLPRVPA